MRAHVLVADDSPVIRAAVRAALVGRGYDVSEAGDGRLALSACEAAAPDVVLLDVEMPNLNGFETLRRLKSDPRLQHIPVVFLTGRTDYADVVAALNDGAHDYLRKPFEPQELVARVSAAARVKWLEDELRSRNEELSRLATVDQLTELPNRRYLSDQIEGMIRTGLADSSCAVMLIDIDHFKRVNDTFGHESGDAVLQEIGRRVRTAVRGSDVVGRWGGEEFLALLPETQLAEAEMVAERLRMGIAARPFELPGGPDIRVTASVGVALARAAEVRGLVGLADEALYEAKSSGRNTVCVRLAA